jgi:aldose 1-epimerase
MHILTLHDPSSPVSAQFVPEAGMIGISLADSGVELLGQRRGLDAYITAGKTMGIPILYPWANRLGGNSYTVDGELVILAPDASGVRADPNGLPIHGLIAGYRGWRVMTEEANELVAELDFGADPALLASFPFPHLLVVRIQLLDRTLRINTAVAATADKAVPLCFGFHPYLRLPDVPRAQWTIETPPLRHLTVDPHGLPTGETSAQPSAVEPLGDRAFDDGYDQPTARYSRCPAVAAASRFTSNAASRRRRSLRPPARTWCVSSRWPPRRMHCAAAATVLRAPASRRSLSFRSAPSPA